MSRGILRVHAVAHLPAPDGPSHSYRSIHCVLCFIRAEIVVVVHTPDEYCSRFFCFSICFFRFSVFFFFASNSFEASLRPENDLKRYSLFSLIFLASLSCELSVCVKSIQNSCVKQSEKRQLDIGTDLFIHFFFSPRCVRTVFVTHNRIIISLLSKMWRRFFFWPHIFGNAEIRNE